MQKNKNTIQQLSHNYDFKINTIDNISEQNLQLILGKHKSNVDFVKNGKAFFEQKFISYILINLLTAIYKKGISELVSDAEIRKLTDEAISEMKKIATKKKIEIDSSKVLADIYAIPEETVSQFLNEKAFLFVSGVLGQINKTDCPTLYKMLLKLSKNC